MTTTEISSPKAHDVGVDYRLSIVIVDGRSIELRPTPWRIFKLLYEDDGAWIPISTIKIQAAVLGDVKWHIRALRLKLGDDVVLSRRGFGYRLNMMTKWS